MKNYFQLLVVLSTLLSCGASPDTDKQRIIDAPPTFNTTVCGNITPPGSVSNSSLGFKISSGSSTYIIIPETSHVQNSLKNLTQYNNICLYSQKALSQTAEGPTLFAQQIKIRVDGTTGI